LWWCAIGQKLGLSTINHDLSTDCNVHLFLLPSLT
jgi:hypothetical protein